VFGNVTRRRGGPEVGEIGLARGKHRRHNNDLNCLKHWVEFGDRRMYLVLLAFGVLLAIAGVVLGASGVSLHDRVFDASIVAPGMLAVTGGLILVGLGLALRVLQRIEGTLAMRPMPRAMRPDEAAPAEPASEPARASVTSRRRMAFDEAAAPAEPAEAKGPQLSRLQFPTLARVETVAVVEESEVSLLPKAALRVNEAVGEINGGHAPPKRTADSSLRTAPRLDLGSRASRSSERSKGPAFDALWPKTPRPARAEQTAPVPDLAPVAPEPEEASEPAPEASAPEEASVSVLKSGMVDGMAYTLYSDGSIEAELPQGALRFGSITELRNHIEQSPPDAASS
jgi:hypothetical protein